MSTAHTDIQMILFIGSLDPSTRTASHCLGLETVPDLRGFATANDLVGKTDEEVRAVDGGGRSVLPTATRGAVILNRWICN
jgi:hypothetical protein